MTAEFAKLPFVGELRSAEALSRRLGFAVRPHRIRVKPGRSAIVAWQREEAGRLGGLEDWGFTAVMTGTDKPVNAQRRAARHGQELTVHEAVGAGAHRPRADSPSPAAGDAVLLSGGVLADPKLGKEIARTLDLLDGDVEVIGYNPGRRVLLRHTPRADAASSMEPHADAAPEFVRIAARPQGHLVAAAEQWRQWGLPTLPVKCVGGRRTAVRTSWWGIGDLARHPKRHFAEAAGTIIAELHRHAPVGPEATAAATADSALARAVRDVDVLTRLLPDRTAALASILESVRQRIGESEGGDPRAIHGDLSPDQVLIGHSECVIIDLDRAGYGPIGKDLGRWIAACRRVPELRALEPAFLDGYRHAGGAAVDLGAWTAWALLVTALEPWRSCSPDWQAETQSIIELAESALDRSAFDRSDGVRDLRVQTTDSLTPVPDAVVIDGEEWPVRRAWPMGTDRVGFEAARSGVIRAGCLDADGTRLLEIGRDPKLPGLQAALAGGGVLVSHRPGRRAVVRLSDGSFAKCVRPGRASGIIAGQRRAAGFEPAFSLPKVLRADEATVVLGALPGTELHEPAELGADWSRAWAESLDAWSSATDTGPDGMPLHDAEAEAGVLDEWRERARPLLQQMPSDAGAANLLAEVDRLLEPLGEQLRGRASGERGHTVPHRNIGPIHRDLHDKQIMWDPVGGPGLLDVDTACRGERELDLGNLRAHARWRIEQDLWTPAEAAAVIDEIARATSSAGLDAERVTIFERATLVRLVCVYAFRPPWRGRLGRLLETARDLTGC